MSGVITVLRYRQINLAQSQVIKHCTEWGQPFSLPPPKKKVGKYTPSEATQH